MIPSRRAWPLLLLLVLVSPAAGDDGKAAGGDSSAFVIADPADASNSAEYIALAPEAWVDAVLPLVRWRDENGLRARIVTVESIDAAYPGEAPLQDRIREFVRHAAKGWKEPRPRFVLLATDIRTRGDEAPAIPAFIVPAPSVGTCASDNPYACVGESRIPDLAVGRFPARDAVELAGFVERTIAYERDVAPAEWRRDFAFIAGEGRFGPVIDTVLESVFTKIVSEMIPYHFDVDLTYHSATSPYFYPPSRFSDRVVERMNEGALVYTYVGHGSEQSFDGQILRVDDVGDVSCEARNPVVFVLACETGHYDNPGQDCIGEALLRRPDGPVAFLGSSRDSQPYANGLLGFGLVLELFSDDRPATFGETIVAAKRRMVSDPKNPERTRFDAMATMFLTPQEMESQRIEHLALYNLLGDPALRLAYPDAACRIEAPAAATAGAGLEVGVTSKDVPAGRAIVTVEVDRRRWVGEVEAAGPGDAAGSKEERILGNYRTANRKVIARAEVEFDGGAFAVAIDLPAGAPTGESYVKVYVEGKEKIAVGSRPIEIRPSAPKQF